MILQSQQKRIFKETGVHKKSSRSHHVFQIRIQTFNNKGRPCQSFLNVVDLAGSERRSQISPTNYRKVQTPASGRQTSRTAHRNTSQDMSLREEISVNAKLATYTALKPRKILSNNSIKRKPLFQDKDLSSLSSLSKKNSLKLGG